MQFIFLPTHIFELYPRHDWEEKSSKLGTRFDVSSVVGVLDESILRRAEDLFDKMFKSVMTSRPTSPKVCISNAVVNRHASCVCSRDTGIKGSLNALWQLLPPERVGRETTRQQSLPRSSVITVRSMATSVHNAQSVERLE